MLEKGWFWFIIYLINNIPKLRILIMFNHFCIYERMTYLYYNISEQDIYLFHQGTNYYSYKMLGCHYITWQGRKGYRFSVWAPHAKSVSVVGDFNHWNSEYHHLTKVNKEGLWVGFFTDVPPSVLLQVRYKNFKR